MYIKLTSDKDLVITKPSTVYIGERNATLANFLIPNMIDVIDCSACVVNMNYILPDGTYGYKPLEVPDIDDNDGETSNKYFISTLVIDDTLTAISGDIRIWLTLSNDADGVFMKSGETIIEVAESYIPEANAPLPDNSVDTPTQDDTFGEEDDPDNGDPSETEGE